MADFGLWMPAVSDAINGGREDNPIMPQTIHRYGELIQGVLIKRYKRFLADVTLADGTAVTAFTPNSGSMTGCSDPGSPVMLSRQSKPGRKTDYTLEMVQAGGVWVGVNTLLANRLAASVVDAGLLKDTSLAGLTVEKREYRYGDSRLDLLLSGGRQRCLVEVKNVTLRKGEAALFPDAVTSRGLKHLRALTRALDEGYLAAMIYMVQRSDCSTFGPAAAIDPAYAQELARAMQAGVAVVPVRLHVRPAKISFVDILSVDV